MKKHMNGRGKQRVVGNEMGSLNTDQKLTIRPIE